MSWSFSFAGHAAAVAAQVAEYKPTMDHEQVEAAKAMIVADLSGWTPDYPVSVIASGHYGSYGANPDGSPRHYRSLNVEVKAIHNLVLNPPVAEGFPADLGNGQLAS